MGFAVPLFFAFRYVILSASHTKSSFTLSNLLYSTVRYLRILGIFLNQKLYLLSEPGALQFAGILMVVIS